MFGFGKEATHTAVRVMLSGGQEAGGQRGGRCRGATTRESHGYRIAAARIDSARISSVRRALYAENSGEVLIV